MDWRVTHALNLALTRHDGIEDVAAFVERRSLFILAGLLIAALVSARGHEGAGLRRGLVAAAPAAALALLIGQGVALLVDRPRPFVAHPSVHPFIAHAADAGFPSDHATGAFAIAVAVVLRSRRWGAALLLLAVAIAVGRVAVGVHYPSDVLAGAALGAACAGLLGRGRGRRLTDRMADRLGGTAVRPAVATGPRARRAPRP